MCPGVGSPAAGGRKELDGWFQAQAAGDSQPAAKQSKTPTVSTPRRDRGNNAEEWRLAMARTARRKRLLPKAEVPLPNGFTALQTEEETAITPGKKPELRQPHLLLCHQQGFGCSDHGTRSEKHGL